jgi:GTP-binding protein
VSFRREAHVPRGGPDGGNGGRGGDVVVVCDQSLRDLRALRRRSHYRARDGAGGKAGLRQGAVGEPLLIGVPPGTQITGTQEDTAGRSWDLVHEGERAVVARGGLGGRGNKGFAGPTRQAPHFAERGLPGERGWLELALKLLADVGLVGLPNAGKSSLLRRLTRATPKVAAYPFTTLEPVLGVLEGEDRQVVVADIPGLIEGASDGAGLGDEFLAHIERTRLLVHVLDLVPELSAGGAPVAPLLANYELIERELARHDARLARLPRVVALSKADLAPRERAATAAAELARRLPGNAPVILTSSATGTGLKPLAAELLAKVPASIPAAAPGMRRSLGARDGAPAGAEGREELAEHMVFRPAGHAGYEVQCLRAGVFELAGERVERLIERFDLENEEALAYVEARLRRLGVLAALRSKGFEAGDEVRVGGSPLALFPSGSS